MIDITLINLFILVNTIVEEKNPCTNSLEAHQNIAKRCCPLNQLQLKWSLGYLNLKICYIVIKDRYSSVQFFKEVFLTAFYFSYAYFSLFEPIKQNYKLLIMILL